MDLLDILDLIDCLEQPGKVLRAGKMVDKQKQLYYDLQVTPPVSL